MILLYIFYACYYRVFYFIEYELDDYGGYLINSFLIFVCYTVPISYRIRMMHCKEPR